MVVFGEHDLARRSPFPRIDLIFRLTLVEDISDSSEAGWRAKPLHTSISNHTQNIPFRSTPHLTLTASTR
ncbi:hypothetical protein BH20ACT10_BH20ACT10_01100 [soil metagenome]|jgi:hypothetical protein